MVGRERTEAWAGEMVSLLCFVLSGGEGTIFRFFLEGIERTPTIGHALRQAQMERGGSRGERGERGGGGGEAALDSLAQNPHNSDRYRISVTFGQRHRWKCSCNRGIKQCPMHKPRSTRYFVLGSQTGDFVPSLWPLYSPFP